MSNLPENADFRDQLAAIAARLNQVEIDCVHHLDALQTLQQQMQELHAREDYYRQLFETAKDGIAVLNAADGDILDTNPYLAGLMGRPEQDMRHMKFWDLCGPAHAQRLEDYFRQLQQAEVIRFDDVCLRSGEGKDIAIDVIANRFVDADGQKVQCNIRIMKGQQWVPETLS